jgi:putative tryptophan/tyrosine transport system substrate-binding protein
MNRREFIARLGGATAWPLAARAQQPAMPVMGVLSSSSVQYGAPGGPDAPLFAALYRGLNEAGYFEGRNITLLFRYADYHYDRLPVLAADLVDKRVAVIVAGAPTSVPKAAQAATDTIPIVFVTNSDPVAVGLVASLSRPGGNITGVAFLTEQLNAKRLQLLHEAVPSARTIAYLFNPTTFDDGRTGRVETGALSLGVGLSIVNATTPREIEVAFAEIVRQRIGALLVDSDPLFFAERDLIIALAARHALPAVYQTREHVAAGGLMGYGTIVPDAFRTAGVYVGRILKGENPGDLPVQQSTRIELAVNLKTAKALGLTVPNTLLALANEVIE